MQFRGEPAEIETVPVETLAARAVAILVWRRHQARLYALRGCEDLDLRYAALQKAIPNTSADPVALYPQLVKRLQTEPALAAKLNAAVGEDFPSAFGRLVTYVLSN